MCVCGGGVMGYWLAALVTVSPIKGTLPPILTPTFLSCRRAVDPDDFIGNCGFIASDLYCDTVLMAVDSIEL